MPQRMRNAVVRTAVWTRVRFLGARVAHNSIAVTLLSQRLRGDCQAAILRACGGSFLGLERVKNGKTVTGGLLTRMLGCPHVD